jgi:eukaryotic-like serine/threonine-protein kinase
MEYVAGQTLRDIISKSGRMALGDVIEILQQVCAGVGAAHKLGIVHRDNPTTSWSRATTRAC